MVDGSIIDATYEVFYWKLVFWGEKDQGLMKLKSFVFCSGTGFG